MALKMEEETIKECYIRDLQPGMVDWRITVRVTSKSRIIPPNKERQRTLLFVDFLDKSGEIRAVALIENLCVKYYPLFEVNNVYMLSNLEVKNKFSNQPPVIKNQYELHFQSNTEVFHCNEVPQIPYNFTLTISEILNKNLIEMGENSIERFIDVIGVLVGADEHCESKVEKGAIESTRNIVLRDRTGEDYSGCEASTESESVTTDQLSTDMFSVKTYDNHEFSCDILKNIKDLNRKSCNWIIKAGITSKSRIVRANEEHTKTFFNIDLWDESGEIRAYAFEDDLDEKFYELFKAFQERNIYLFSNLKVEKTCSKEPIKHRYQLIFHEDTKVVQCEGKINIKYDSVPIVNIQSTMKGDFVDIIGICINIGHVVEIVEKGVLEVTRNIELSDGSGMSVVVHLRGPEAVRFNSREGPIVAIKRGYVTVFDDENRILSDSYNTNIDIKEACDLFKRHKQLYFR